MLKFSVVIPTYNCQDSIERVINSLLKQKYPTELIEIICVDDKSRDNTIKIIKKFNNIRLIELPKNHGNGQAKNIGGRLAKGDIIFFLDDHVILIDNVLSEFNLLFSEHKDIDGICGYYESLQLTDKNIFRDIRRRTVYGKNNKEKFITKKSFKTFSIVIGAIKKEVFLEEQFPSNFGQNSSEDTAWQISLLEKNKKFLYSSRIKGFHDHNLNKGLIYKKIIIETKGVGDLIYFLIENQKSIPYQYGYLSYPLFFLLFSIIALSQRRIFLFFVLLTLIEFLLPVKVFFDRKTSILLKMKAYFYILTEELFKLIYLPYYLAKKVKFNIKFYLRFFRQLIIWEVYKFFSIFQYFYEI